MSMSMIAHIVEMLLMLEFNINRILHIHLFLEILSQSFRTTTVEKKVIRSRLKYEPSPIGSRDDGFIADFSSIDKVLIFSLKIKCAFD